MSVNRPESGHPVRTIDRESNHTPLPRCPRCGAPVDQVELEDGGAVLVCRRLDCNHWWRTRRSTAPLERIEGRW